jgi:hypothetical protein
MFGEKEPFEEVSLEWLRERTIDEALDEAEITQEQVLMILLQLGYIKLPPWLDDFNSM